MEKLPIFIGANPKLANRSAIVFLDSKGSWVLNGQDFNDSVLSILTGENPSSLRHTHKLEPHKVVELVAPVYVAAEFEHKGSERHISLFAFHEG